jgi:hypothetical protein
MEYSPLGTDISVQSLTTLTSYQFNDISALRVSWMRSALKRVECRTLRSERAICRNTLIRWFNLEFTSERLHHNSMPNFYEEKPCGSMDRPKRIYGRHGEGFQIEGCEVENK